MRIRGNLALEDRLIWLREHLGSAGRVTLPEAANALEVSEMTIRRDLQELEALGYARRVRGGAIAAGPVPLADRRRQDAAAKGRIAAKVLPLLPQSGAIGIDASSTLLRVVTTMEGGRDLTIVTNSIETFEAAHSKPGVRALVTGGSLDPRTGSLVGPFAIRSAGEILTERLFMSAAGLEPEIGPSEACPEEAEVKLAFAQSAREVLLCIASSKLGTRSVSRSVPWARIKLLITELEPSDARLDPYRGLTEIL
jgi:DeoR family fructose operon transcriptional repressor